MATVEQYNDLLQWLWSNSNPANPNYNPAKPNLTVNLTVILLNLTVILLNLTVIPNEGRAIQWLTTMATMGGEWEKAGIFLWQSF